MRWIPQSPTDLIDFEHLDETRLAEVAPGARICRWRGSGQVGVLRGGRCVVAEGMQPEVPAEIAVDSIRNANSGQCLGPDRRQSVCEEGDPGWGLRAVPGTPGRWQLVEAANGRCLVASRGRLALAACGTAPEQHWELERIGNTFRIRTDGPERACLAIRDRALEAGARAVLAPCPAPGRADFHWEIDGYRDAVDYESLFAVRSLAGTLAWQAAPDEALPYPITGASGAPVCRADGALGTVADGGCAIPGRPPAQAYELLVSATPLR